MNVFPQFVDYNEGFKQLAQYLGACFSGDSQNADFRAFKAGSGFLGYVNKDQGTSGAYSGLSFVLFPFARRKSSAEDSSIKNHQNEQQTNAEEDRETIESSNLNDIEYLCVISIGIGLSDLGDDEELANLPYMRRAYLKFHNLPYFCQTPTSKSFFIKNSFADYSSPLSPLYEKIDEIQKKYVSIFTFDLDGIKPYITKLPAAAIISLTNYELDLIKNFGEKDTKDTKDYNGSRSIPKSTLITKITSLTGGCHILLRWLAQYALIREWLFGGPNKKTIQEKIISLNNLSSTSVTSTTHINEIKGFLHDYKYVVLEGAPGVGKTWIANQIAPHYNESFFIQFHAETTYADFIGGIRPVLHSQNIQYEYHEGILTKAILRALKNPKDEILLIIDEINRANLANVLGPVFYLFEKNTGVRNAAIDLETGHALKQGEVDAHFTSDNSEKESQEIDKGICEIKGSIIALKKLPENLHVLATMNTADRSLAVADFALRRRFLWYPLFPQTINNQGSLKFDKTNFNKIANMFEKYASDEELNLQPGQSYFLIDNGKTYAERLKYEIMPLMKEYFNEGYLTKMIEEFSQYYTKITNDFMYR